jgi:hypothetical protein
LRRRARGRESGLVEAKVSRPGQRSGIHAALKLASRGAKIS